jgi:DNA ligase-associated metallophosphoesterase
VISIRLNEHELHLLPGRAAWRPSSRTLYIADIHVGKASAFARGGIPLNHTVLERGTTADLARLTALITATDAARLVILGDLLHAPAGRDPRTLGLLADWRHAHASVEVILVRGNHDQAAGDPPCEAGITCIDAPSNDNGIQLLHHPLPVPLGVPTLAGHLHPAVRLATAGDAARRPCYWLSANQLVLPAFGGFTGAGGITPRPGDRVFVQADNELVEVPVIVMNGATGTRRTRSMR